MSTVFSQQDEFQSAYDGDEEVHEDQLRLLCRCMHVYIFFAVEPHDHPSSSKNTNTCTREETQPRQWAVA